MKDESVVELQRVFAAHGTLVLEATRMGTTYRAGSRRVALAVVLGLFACVPEGVGGSRVDAGRSETVDASGRDASEPGPSELDASVSERDAATPERDGATPERDAGTDGATEPELCLDRLVACSDDGPRCCGDRTCGTTTAGRVCCGGEGAACATPDGSDCCGSTLLCVGGRCQPPGGPAPRFSAPYPCGERWTYDHHSAEVRQALDFVRSDGVATNGSVQVASAPGVATRHVQAGGAGNYVVLDHGDGWSTYYFHLSDYLVAHGAWVDRGDPIGRTGSTGASSGPHIHYEQLKGGVGRVIHIEGVSLAPYPSVYGVSHLVSENSCSTEGRHFTTWGSDRTVHERPSTAAPIVARFAGATRVLVDCQISGEEVSTEGYVNRWWAHLPEHGGYVTNIYIDDPASYLPGVAECP